jgi:hypothetical protein
MLTNRCLQGLALKTKELHTNLGTLCTHVDESQNNRRYLTREDLAGKNLPATTARFLYNLAIAENMT